MPKRKRDPFAAREADKYAYPVPSREFILQHLEERGSPANYEQLLQELQLTQSPEQEGLRRRLRAMIRDGQLVCNRRGYYGLLTRMQLLAGRVVGHKDGFGFVIPEDGSEDLFLSPRQMRLLFDGDRILARVATIDRRGRREAELVDILERHTQTIVGRFVQQEDVAFVVPDNKRISQTILVKADKAAGAKDGQIVIVELLSYPSRQHHAAVGQVIEVLGEHMAPSMEIDIATRVHGLPHVWPDEVLKQIAEFKSTIDPKAIIGREDIRQWPLVTIDGEDAQDFDDAVYCQANKHGQGWKLWVAIADVSHYVTPGSALDEEALKRGNSVYFPGRVLPMLPEILSNHLCSLQPNVDRLAIVCEMSISGQGKLSRYRFFPAVMCSHARLTYTEVAAILEDNDAELSQRYTQLLPHLQQLHLLYQVLREARVKRGAIDFDKPETRIVFGPERKIDCIVPVCRNVAHRLIEECMLMANVAAARYLQKEKLPILYRVHESPNVDKLAEVREFLAELGLNLPGGDCPEPADYAHLLEKISARVDSGLIQTVLLRSLSQAVYSADNKGHFGLAFMAYTHFTSPIRRYPDLLVHRAICQALANPIAAKAKVTNVGLPTTEVRVDHDIDKGGFFVRVMQQVKNHRGNGFIYSKEVMQQMGEHCSLMERRADEATRDVVAWLKCEFMLEHIGEKFSGIINAVTSFGLFVELKEFYVEGMLHVTALTNDYYHFDPIKRRLRGERTGKSYRLGDPIDIMVARVDLDEKQIDFVLPQDDKPKKRKPKSTKKGKPKCKK